MGMWDRRRLDALAIAAAPIALLVGVLVHPYLSDFTDTAEMARAVSDGPDRWGWAHVLIGLSLTLTVLAVFALRHHLKARGENDLSFWAVPFVTVGGGMTAFFTGAEGLGAWAAERTGTAGAFADAVNDWSWLYLVAVALLSIGLLLVAVAVSRADLVAGMVRRVVIAAIVLVVIAGFIPAGWALYVAAVAGLLAFVPLAAAVLTERE